MNYDEIVEIVSQLDHQDKLKLSQFLVKILKDEKDNNEEGNKLRDIDFIVTRIRKSKPLTYPKLVNFIKTMFNFQGGIDDSEINLIIDNLYKNRVIEVQNNKIIYL
jgi:hypothetical protein